MKRSNFLISFLSIACFFPSFLLSARPENDTTVKKIQIIDLGGARDRNEAVAQVFYETMMPGFQESDLPRFVIAGKEHKFLLGLGGYVNARLGYDMGGISESLDFVTYDIPTVKTPATRQQLIMDASTSRLFFKVIGIMPNGKKLVGYIETDFRGGGSGYMLRLRQAYVSYAGWTFGQTATTFCDLAAGPNTIDFEGPNAYTYNRNVMIRYMHRFGNHWQVAIALERPAVSAGYRFPDQQMPQRVPDIPAYVQYNWNDLASHVRLSGLYRYMVYTNPAEDRNGSQNGWGIQLSGLVNLWKKLDIRFQGVYGEGIAQYIQDLSGNNLDMVWDSRVPGRLQDVKTYGWFAGAQYNFSEKIFASATFSQVRVYSPSYFSNPDMYRRGQYIVGNVFWNPIPSLQVGLEYLWGSRKNQDNLTGYANRLQTAVQYNF